MIEINFILNILSFEVNVLNEIYWSIEIFLKNIFITYILISDDVELS